MVYGTFICMLEKCRVTEKERQEKEEEGEGGRDRRRERDTSPIFAHSPNDHNSHDWHGQKPGAWNSV